MKFALKETVNILSIHVTFNAFYSNPHLYKYMWVVYDKADYAIGYRVYK
jgi:hypothetical protein